MQLNRLCNACFTYDYVILFEIQLRRATDLKSLRLTCWEIFQAT